MPRQASSPAGPAGTRALLAHQDALAACRACPRMQGTPVLGEPVLSRVLLVGQAPGIHELDIKRHFAWSAGRTLFTWFESIGLDEAAFRRQVYMAAVCRCFPGRRPGGGDRVPGRDEIGRCAGWLDREIALLAPRLLLPVGRLAIAQFLPGAPLVEHVGRVHRVTRAGRAMDVVPLPHPSGASPWHRSGPGKALLGRALECIAAHRAWQALQRS